MRKIVFACTFLCCSASALHAQERQWALDATDREAFLVFGVPDTDDVGLSFWCEIGSDKLSAFLPANLSKLHEGEKTTMNVVVDGKSFSVPSKADKNTNGKFTVEGQFPLKAPLTEKLQKGQELTVSIKGHTTTYPLADADFASLYTVCKGENAIN